MPQEGWPLVWNLGAIFGTAFGASSVFILALFLGLLHHLRVPEAALDPRAQVDGRQEPRRDESGRKRSSAT